MALILNKGRYFTKGEAVLLGDGLLLTKTAYQANKEIPTHLHQESYLAVVIAGDYRELGKDFDDTVKPGASIYHPGREVHKNYIGKAGATLLNLEMPDSFWEQKGLADLKPAQRILGQDPRYLDYATRISDEMANPKRLGLIGIEGLALQILDLFLRLNNQPEEAPRLLEKVDGFLHEHFSQPLTIDQIAGKFEVSAGWLSRKFRQHYGENISDRIIRLRINEAIRLLNNTNKTLAEIAVNVGFFDQSHFTRTFKKKRGTSPGHYRRASKPKLKK